MMMMVVTRVVTMARVAKVATALAKTIEAS
jgi:hypothetical protein